jgi:diketogulonate reductase-like aldo/keto reductase
MIPIHSTPSGYVMPSIAYGTWTLGSGQGPIDQIAQAFDTNYYHIGKHL